MTPRLWRAWSDILGTGSPILHFIMGQFLSSNIPSLELVSVRDHRPLFTVLHDGVSFHIWTPPTISLTMTKPSTVMVMLERALGNLDVYEPVVITSNFFVDRIQREYSAMKTEEVKKDFGELIRAMADVVVNSQVGNRLHVSEIPPDV